MTLFSLADSARAFGITLTPAQDDAFETYYRNSSLERARQPHGDQARDDVLVKHFLDSLSVVAVARRQRVMTSAQRGLSRIPLKIALPYCG